MSFRKETRWTMLEGFIKILHAKTSKAKRNLIKKLARGGPAKERTFVMMGMQGRAVRQSWQKLGFAGALSFGYFSLGKQRKVTMVRRRWQQMIKRESLL